MSLNVEKYVHSWKYKKCSFTIQIVLHSVVNPITWGATLDAIHAISTSWTHMITVYVFQIHNKKTYSPYEEWTLYCYVFKICSLHSWEDILIFLILAPQLIGFTTKFSKRYYSQFEAGKIWSYWSMLINQVYLKNKACSSTGQYTIRLTR